MISHLNAQLPVADGIALAELLAGRNKVTLAYSGDGGTSEGDFHEALNVAAVWNLPVIFLIENNGYGLSTPNNEQYKCEYLVSRGAGYGMKAVQIDGNNILEVYDTISRLSADMRENPHPVLVEALTFRMRGHEEASGTKYVPQELLEKWAKLDPVSHYEQFLIQEGLLSEALMEQIRSQIKEEINVGLEKAFLDKMPEADTEQEMQDIYMPFVQTPVSLLQVTHQKKGILMPSQMHSAKVCWCILTWC
jgi:2-oxoisovalerate dehydrogenase E1 component